MRRRVEGLPRPPDQIDGAPVKIGISYQKQEDLDEFGGVYQLPSAPKADAMPSHSNGDLRPLRSPREESYFREDKNVGWYVINALMQCDKRCLHLRISVVAFRLQ